MRITNAQLNAKIARYKPVSQDNGLEWKPPPEWNYRGRVERPTSKLLVGAPIKKQKLSLNDDIKELDL